MDILGLTAQQSHHFRAAVPVLRMLSGGSLEEDIPKYEEGRGTLPKVITTK